MVVTPSIIEIALTATTFAIGWTGTYTLEGDGFVYVNRESGRGVTILGYPTARIAQLG